MHRGAACGPEVGNQRRGPPSNSIGFWKPTAPRQLKPEGAMSQILYAADLYSLNRDGESSVQDRHQYAAANDTEAKLAGRLWAAATPAAQTTATHLRVRRGSVVVESWRVTDINAT